MKKTGKDGRKGYVSVVSGKSRNAGERGVNQAQYVSLLSQKSVMDIRHTVSYESMTSD